MMSEADPTYEQGGEGSEWLSAEVERWAIDHLAITPPLVAMRVGEGQSNVTSRVIDFTGRCWILREAPPARGRNPAHDMHREAAIIAAVGGTDFPVPKVLGTGVRDDGRPFFAMEEARGRPVDSEGVAAHLPSPSLRHALGIDVVERLAQLHSLDPDRLDLPPLRPNDDHFQRQLTRLSAVWRELGPTSDDALWEDLVRRLERRRPRQQATVLTHGDYRLGNIMAQGPAVTAVLDWELAALGDPLIDLAGLMVDWRRPDEPRICTASPTRVGSFPSREEMMGSYAEISGLDLYEMSVYRAFQCWRGATFLRGVVERRRRGDLGTHGAVDDDLAAWSVTHLLEEADRLLGTRTAGTASSDRAPGEEDDRPHAPGPEINFNESMYFHIVDHASGLSGFLRLASRPNERTGERTVCLFLPTGEVAFSFARPDFGEPGRFVAAGMEVTIEKPFLSHRVSFEGEVAVLAEPKAMSDPKTALSEARSAPLRADLEFEAAGPLHLGSPLGEGFAANHYEQQMHVRGRVSVGEDEIEIAGTAMRDHSWGAALLAGPVVLPLAPRWYHGFRLHGRRRRCWRGGRGP